MTAGRTLMAHRSRTFFISRRPEKEYGSADVTKPFRSQLANWRGVTWRILSKSARLYTVMLNYGTTDVRRHYLQVEAENATGNLVKGCGEPG
jgi:hypothetical protein